MGELVRICCTWERELTNFQLKLLSGLLFSLAICLGVVLILPDNKVAETVTPELPKQVVKVEEKIEVPQKQIIDGFNFAEKPVEKNKLASADELDAFFNEI